MWCGLDANRGRAMDAIARAMYELYRLPYAAFARWSPAGTPDDVAEFLTPYLAAGCTTVNLIGCGEDADTVIDMAARVRTLLQAQAHALGVNGNVAGAPGPPRLNAVGLSGLASARGSQRNY